MGKHGRVIGLTGKIASGKGMVAQILSRKGFSIIDLDSLGHEALLKAKASVIEAFGDAILDSGGEINRKSLGAIVFRNSPSLDKLETILHPLMRARVQELLLIYQEKDVVLDAALLYRMGLDSFCDQVLVVEAYLPIRLFRLCYKRKIPFSYALKILARQKKLVPKNPKNVMIKNSGSKGALSRAVDQLNLD